MISTASCRVRRIVIVVSTGLSEVMPDRPKAEQGERCPCAEDPRILLPVWGQLELKSLARLPTSVSPPN